MYVCIRWGEPNTPFQSAGLACSWEFAHRCWFMKIPRTDRYVVSASMVLTLVVCKIFFPGKYLMSNLPCATASATQKNQISMDRER
jgi:hypothetical protein